MKISLQSLEEISYKDIPRLFTKDLFQRNELKPSICHRDHAFHANGDIELLIESKCTK